MNRRQDNFATNILHGKKIIIHAKKFYMINIELDHNDFKINGTRSKSLSYTYLDRMSTS